VFSKLQITLTFARPLWRKKFDLMQVEEILLKAIDGQDITLNEGLFLFRQAPLGLLMMAAHQVRLKKAVPGKVSWIIDRNVNITNGCVSRCKFCNFHRVPQSNETYITTIEEYKQKIDEMYALGGRQLLLQGGMHPQLGIEFYEELFRKLKSYYTDLKLHALGPPEIDFLAKKAGLDWETALKRLMDSGLDSLPGAGAEVLSDRVRKLVSPAKCTVNEWLGVMQVAHKLGMVTSATMMFGHAETLEERLNHLILLRGVQAEKPKDAPGFISFTCWPFQAEGTRLQQMGYNGNVSASEYIRMIAISRLILNNIPNIQASWLTVGPDAGMLSLHAGANDLGSIMIEENVVSAAGASFSLNAEGMQRIIRLAGFEPVLRNQQYEFIV
jgi:cyclic dehypoxanthinyl futalosine synthase